MRLAFAALLVAVPMSGQAAPTLSGLHVTNGSALFQGDGPLLTTVSPNGDGFRDAAHVFFDLSAPATVRLDVVQTDTVGSDPEDTTLTTLQTLPARSFSAGPGEITWRPPSSTAPRTYALDLTVTGPNGATRVYGVAPPGAKPVAPIVRVQGIDAGFSQSSYEPGQLADVTVSTDAKFLSFQVFAYEGGAFPTDRDQRTNSEAMTSAARVDWRAHRDAPSTLQIVRPGDWPSGLYFLRISADDGRVGYAPFVVRPKTLGKHRVAVVLATQTWQAYNFADENGDGWGDSWYVSGSVRHVDLARPFLDFGLPYRFGDWDLSFLTWLQQTSKSVDFLTDADLNQVTGAQLARAYTLIVFPGHEEYTTAHQFDAIEKYRDLGGNLAFLSANNFFWQVKVDGTKMTKVAQWRDAGQPEAALVGAQYAGSNHGSVLLPFVVGGAAQAPWLFAGTGLTNGSSFGNYGIEIDATAAVSPAGTLVLATIPNALGNGKQAAQMTYYETSNGAKVFAAGALDFAASVDSAPVSTMMQNLWSRLSSP